MDIAASIAEFWQALQSLDVHQFIEENGNWFYAITFVWTFLEGETFVLFAGAAAAQDVLDLHLLILVAWLGSFCGDQCYFYLGRRFGPRLLKKFPKMQKGVDKVGGYIRKHDILFILSYRFLYGIRNVSSFGMGMTGLDWQKFAFWNFIAAGLWAFAFSMIGYLFGEALDHMMGEAVEYFMMTLVGIILVFFVGKFLWEKLRPHKDKEST